MDAGFPGQNVWPLTLVGVAIVLVAVRGQTLLRGSLVGFTAGCAFYLVHISWAAEYLGPVPWLALSVTESLFWAGFGALAALSYALIPRVWPGTCGRYVAVPLVVAALWVGREELSGSWPYGGFSWGRVAMSQSTGPFAPLVSWGGMAALSFSLVALVAVAVSLVADRDRWLQGATAVAAVTALLLVVPVFPSESSGTYRVAAVQGNGPAGYFSERARGDLFSAQLNASAPVRDETVDAVVWPENASEYDPLSSDREAERLSGIAAWLGAPLTLGTVTQRDGLFYNSTLSVAPDAGVVDFYDKKHPVPFGEYVPDRAFWESLAPDLIGLIQREYVPGQRDGVLQLGKITAGSAICFDITDDRAMRSLISDGAEIILAQSNNADFGRTDESEQQLAIARLRAIELGRTVVNISTVGTSATVAADGSTLTQLEPYTAGVMFADVTTSRSVTAAARWGESIAIFLSIAPLVLLLTALAATSRVGLGSLSGRRRSPIS
ncbi:apolipoprotein N-acyltransferase [Cnuibacter physcomitrellae]|uniref:Apolipoprotein N-acyltransferase n=1 Tax=Cnuibacter physcomitrellae TaxID=1619308 RepID=A0A1X9LTT6_9MICO|nr:apolipoprotein N-acyltransferase [Cnuibacter physcomitrellae]ARJ07738.1 apolipoprotein N-acyltransferase [Cnuibacter physcomitrellae]GGI42970.1 apolipoprotein N-acyltransferase [Cnuibacter physcomitrellae]